MDTIKASVKEFHIKMAGHVSGKDLEDIRIGLTKLNAFFDPFIGAMERAKS